MQTPIFLTKLVDDFHKRCWKKSLFKINVCYIFCGKCTIFSALIRHPWSGFKLRTAVTGGDGNQMPPPSSSWNFRRISLRKVPTTTPGLHTSTHVARQPDGSRLKVFTLRRWKKLKNFSTEGRRGVTRSHPKLLPPPLFSREERAHGRWVVKRRFVNQTFIFRRH
jgi:hypothetical protein